jgi:hypothetical protein
MGREEDASRSLTQKENSIEGRGVGEVRRARWMALRVARARMRGWSLTEMWDSIT